MAHTSRNRKENPLENGQNVGSLGCHHCPFRSDSQQTLDRHEHHHSENYSHKCPFCTFTAESTPLILDHIKLVHPEKTDKVFKVKYSKPNCNSSAKKVALRSTKVNAKVAPVSVKLKVPFETAVEPLSKKSVRPNILSKQPNLNKMIPPKANKLEEVNIPKESNRLTDDGSTTDSEDESRLWCICRQPVGEQFMVCCDGCENWFHGSCVGITPAKNRQLDALGTKWFCPHCTRKDSLLKLHSKVTQAMTSLSAQFRANSFQNSIPPTSKGDSSEPPNLKSSDIFSYGNEAPSSPPNLQNDEEALQREETVCRMEMEKLVADIRAGHEALVNKSNALKEEDGRPSMLVSSTKQADEIRHNINQLEMKDRAESLELAVLLEFKESGQQRLKELTNQKIQLEVELAPLKEVSKNKKIKLEPSGSKSCELEELIQQKETLLEDVKIKLMDILKEDNNFMARIRVVEGELAENAKKLMQMRAELGILKNNPTGGLPSANSIQMNTLKIEQRARIAELSRLERRLVQISCGYVFDEINRKEEEAKKAVDDY